MYKLPTPRNFINFPLFSINNASTAILIKRISYFSSQFSYWSIMRVRYNSTTLFISLIISTSIMKSFQNIIYCNEHITILFSLYPPHIFLIQHKFFAENILHLIKFRNFSLEKHSGNYIKYHKMILFVTIFIF